MEVSHLLFANDSLILKEKMEYLSWIVMWFDTILGLKNNLEKSE